MSSTIAILLTTYNGEHYLREQLDSLLSQSDTDWHLYIHDDGSTDGTQQIVSSYVERYPRRITLLQATMVLKLSTTTLPYALVV